MRHGRVVCRVQTTLAKHGWVTLCQPCSEGTQLLCIQGSKNLLRQHIHHLAVAAVAS